MGKKRLFSAINIVLSFVLTVSVLLLAREVAVTGLASTIVRKAEAAKEIAVTQKTPELQQYSSLTRENIFGFAPSELRPLSSINQADGGVPAQVTLIGTVSGDLGYAVVLRDQKEELYRVGQEIPGVGRLVSLNENQAIIRTPGGSTSRLQIKDLMQMEEPQKKQASLTGEPQFARETSKSSYLLDRGAIDEAIQNPTGILTHARLLPNFSSGKQQGFIVNEVKPRGIFDQLGIKNGDVLLRINELEISGPDAALRAFTALRGMDRVELDILRGGQKQTFTYQIR